MGWQVESVHRRIIRLQRDNLWQHNLPPATFRYIKTVSFPSFGKVLLSRYRLAANLSTVHYDSLLDMPLFRASQSIFHNSFISIQHGDLERGGGGVGFGEGVGRFFARATFRNQDTKGGWRSASCKRAQLLISLNWPSCALAKSLVRQSLARSVSASISPAIMSYSIEAAMFDMPTLPRGGRSCMDGEDF